MKENLIDARVAELHIYIVKGLEQAPSISKLKEQAPPINVEVKTQLR